LSCDQDADGRDESGHDEAGELEQLAAYLAGLAAEPIPAHTAGMTHPEETPVMEPFPDKTGTGWHVVIRYREGHERLIEGFASKAEAVDWIEANVGQVRE
jgi:hypothetical protein